MIMMLKGTIFLIIGIVSMFVFESIFGYSCSSIRNFWNDSDINSDFETLLKAFPENNVGEDSQKNWSDYDDIYSSDKKMAALFRDIHGERF